MLKICTLFLVLVHCYSCNMPSNGDLESAKKKILALEATQRDYHFTKNAKNFVALFSTDFISIGKGKIEKPTREQSFNRFDQYFKSVEFVKWDNKTEPTVRFSNDATMAYVAVDKLVILKVKNDARMEVLDTTNFAWLSFYKKIDKTWQMDCIASTNK